MVKIQAYTPQGMVLVDAPPDDDRAKKEVLTSEISAAVTIEQRLKAIEKYLGV